MRMRLWQAKRRSLSSIGHKLERLRVESVVGFNIFKDGNEVFFKIKRSTQLQKLMTTYCDRQSVQFNSIAFFFDGCRLHGEQTPNESLPSPLHSNFPPCRLFFSTSTTVSFCCCICVWKGGNDDHQMPSPNTKLLVV